MVSGNRLACFWSFSLVLPLNYERNFARYDAYLVFFSNNRSQR